MKTPERIIVIDDDSINNMYCKYIINEALNEKVEIITFAVPQKAVDYINTEYSVNPVPTLIFLDINMPGLSGWDVLKEFQKSENIISKYFNIYMLSSSVDPKDRQRAQSSKYVDGFLEKPLDARIVSKICGIS